MSDKALDQADGQTSNPVMDEARRLLTEIQQLRARAEEHCKATENARKNADSEGLFAVNAKRVCEEHATAISQLKGAVESEANTIKTNKQKSDELLAALTAGKASVDADTKGIGDRRKEVENAMQAIEAARDGSASQAQEIDKIKASVDEALTAIEKSSEDAALAQKGVESSQGEVKAIAENAQNALKLLLEDQAKSNERSNEIQKTLQAAKANEEELEQVLAHLRKSDEISSGHEVRVAKQIEELDALLKRVDGLLPGATSASLASSFNAQKNRFAEPQKRWLKTFIWCIVGLVLVALPSFLAALGVPVMEHSTSSTTSEIWRGLLLRMPIVIPLVWLAIYAGRNYMLSLRLEEEYAYKEAVSTAFEGYKREMKDIGVGDAANPSPLIRLCGNILAAIAERPGRIYEGKHKDITILNESHGAAQEVVELAKKNIAAR